MILTRTLYDPYIIFIFSISWTKRWDAKAVTVFLPPCNWVILLLFRKSKCMHSRPNCSLGLFYLLEGTNLARNILGQTPSTLILLALCSIFSFLCFQYSFHPSPASFSNSAVLTLSCSAFCRGTNIHPLISLHKSVTERSSVI